jgi:hypothetical protein
MAEILRHRRETRRQTDEIKPLPKLPRHLSTLPHDIFRVPCDGLLDVFFLDAGGEVVLRAIGNSFDTGIETQHLPSLTHMTL